MTLQPSIIKHWIIFGVDIINDTLRYSNIIDNQISVQVLQCYPEDKEGKYFDSLEMVTVISYSGAIPMESKYMTKIWKYSMTKILNSHLRQALSINLQKNPSLLMILANWIFFILLFSRISISKEDIVPVWHFMKNASSRTMSN